MRTARIILGICIGVSLLAVGLRLVWGFLPIPIGIRHYLHSIIQPEDLYDPLVVDAFRFSERGYSKTYQLRPRYLDLHEMGLLPGPKGIESGYRFQGKLRVEVLSKGQVVLDRTVTAITHAWYADKEMARYKQVVLIQFAIPVGNWHLEDLSVRVTVVEPDQSLVRIDDGGIHLYIAVSGSP
jgi:hypothetical protein